MRKKKFIKSIILFLLIFLSIGDLLAQNYRDQKSLIRLKANFSMVFGQIKDYSGHKLTGATISVFNPTTFSISETIPVDDAGEYLFTIEKGKTIGLIVEKDGYFPYYHELTIPATAENQLEIPLHLPDGIRKDYTLVYHPEEYIPSNASILEEMVSLLLNQTELSLWMPDQENPLGKSRIVFLDSLIQSRGIEKYRLISGSIPGNKDQIVELNFETDPDAQRVSTWDSSGSLSNEKDDKWTLQFSASKSKLTERDLKGLKGVVMYEGTDGFYRYTYGLFDTRQEANQAIQTLKDKGFSQAFPKLIGTLKKL